jgi:hypothetical protein
MFFGKSLGQLDFILKNAILSCTTCLNDAIGFWAMTSSPIFLNGNPHFFSSLSARPSYYLNDE